MITFTTITQLGTCLWQYDWTATTEPYRIYWQGKLWATVYTNTYLMDAPDGYTDEPPALEILDDDDEGTAENLTKAQRGVLQWREVDNATHYVIQEYVGGVWTTRDYLPHSDCGYQVYWTGRLADVTTAQWRVLARDDYQNSSSAINFTFLVVRNPNPPAVEMTYDADTVDVTISAA